MTTSTGTYAQVNGLNMYYEVHGAGRPIVLLHGGLLTIDLSFAALIPALAATRQVIAVELQGHGRTADIERAITFENLSDDVVALLDQLGTARTDLFGFSLGGLTATQTAIRHPDRVDRLVAASVHFRPDGYHPEIRNPALHAGSTRMPTAADFAEMQRAYARIAPDPGHFGAFMAKTSGVAMAFEGWSDDALGAITAPTLVLVGDHDFVRLEHAGQMRELIPGAQLAVLPDCTHMAVTQRVAELIPMLDRFLA